MGAAFTSTSLPRNICLPRERIYCRSSQARSFNHAQLSHVCACDVDCFAASHERPTHPSSPSESGSYLSMFVLTYSNFYQKIDDNFRVVLRTWRAVQFAKRNGRLHQINSFVKGRDLADGTVICPACPIPYVNFDPSQLPDADSPDR